MAFLAVDTQDGLREVTVFNREWVRFRDDLEKGATVVMKGTKQGEQVIFSGMQSLNNYKENMKEGN